MRTARLAIALVLAVTGDTLAQPSFSAELTAEQQSYAYGETITLTYTLTNTGSETVDLYGSSSPGCGVGLTVGLFRLPASCVLDEVVYVFDPGESNAWIWTLVPSELGIPETDSPMAEATLLLNPRGQAAPDASASLTIPAPRYLGGVVSVGFSEAERDTVDALRVALGGEVTWSSMAIPGLTQESWQLTGTAVLDALARLTADGNLRYAERAIGEVGVVYTPTDGGPGATVIRPPAPNPAIAQATFTVRPIRPGPVRIDLTDIRGRLVGVLHDGPLASERTFTVSTAGLPAGVYVVHVVADGVRQAHRLTVVR